MRHIEFLDKLRAKNMERRKVWDPDDVLGVSVIDALFRSNEMVDEADKAANEIKKLVREEIGICGACTTTEKLAEELADVIICVDLVAAIFDIDLIDAVTKKFNKTSDAVNIDVKL